MTKQKSYWHHTDFPIRKVNSSILIILIVVIASCKSEKLHWTTKQKNTLESIPEIDSILVLEGVSKSSKYGYTPEAPITLGVRNQYVSVTYPEKYLNSLTGPQGEQVLYERVKSCCFFKTANSDAAYQNVGVLEIYEVSYEGLKTPKLLYLNFFDEGKAFAPQGFLPKKTIASTKP
ncbi:hypothetical protein [Ohtaekwangia koreensis]|uniref:2-dehydro-3-deoxyphosphooctonate aldolase n=1 Tax=Ohtaekwangia koreensis TaxID=688867 RepID=A0A1T5J8G9_9BACT|nr:hypothetical protein [Ohtaekwangia koreensis]SKC47711.1 hypothetical protein SAMN05660236_0866 [Ohtaekwangia koreensis]